MLAEVAHKSWWQIFEVVSGIPFLVALLMQRVFPILFTQGIMTPVLIPTGVFLLLLGFVFVILARREFARYGQPTDPGHPTSQLLTSGVFSISRNPLYFGGILIQAGLSLVFKLPWILIFLFPSIIACQTILIVVEERYLTARFGNQYLEYAMKVHRWIGRK